ncbi:MAG: hypothetical protein Ct9H90mP8_3740 [Pseudomonadota bacterium]|nr:MAG: hypothetical protein Ct9H90mP8_3740 [Pseudomonadota bacterium]
MHLHAPGKVQHPKTVLLQEFPWQRQSIPGPFKKNGKKIGNDGELTLPGQVLPVGGIREKLVGARLGGIKQIIPPRPTKPQYEELPDYKKNIK